MRDCGGMAERLRDPSPMEAPAKTRGNAEAMRSTRSDVIRRGRERDRLCLVTFRLFFSAPVHCSKTVTFLLQMRSQLSRIVLSSSSDLTRPPLIEWEELAAESFQLPPAKKKKKKTSRTLKFLQLCLNSEKNKECSKIR